MIGFSRPNENLFRKIKLMSNRKMFRILELTEKGEMNITAISKKINLSYTKCADYIRALEKENLVKKRKSGRKAFVKSNVSMPSLSVLITK